MASKSGNVVFAILSLLVVAVPILAIVGGWKAIENPNEDKVVVDVAKSAVEEYNKESNKSLVFVSVVKADEQVVAGIKYRLIISTDDGNYKALVWSKLDKSITLVSFDKQVTPA